MAFHMTFGQWIDKYNVVLESIKLSFRTDVNVNLESNATHWQCTLKRPYVYTGRTVTTDLSMGSNHKDGPQLETVLKCLQGDMQNMEFGFEVWRSAYNYKDTPEANKIYHTCMKIKNNMDEMVGLAGRMELQYCTDE